MTSEGKQTKIARNSQKQTDLAKTVQSSHLLLEDMINKKWLSKSQSKNFKSQRILFLWKKNAKR